MEAKTLNEAWEYYSIGLMTKDEYNDIYRIVENEVANQRKIDIEKACEWLTERCAFGVHPCSGTALVMEFRKAMEG